METDVREAFQEVKESIKELREYIDFRFAEFEKHHDEAAKPLRDMVEKHEKLISGNGEDGLITNVSKLKDKVGDYSKVVWIFVAGVIGILLDLIFNRKG